MTRRSAQAGARKTRYLELWDTIWGYRRDIPKRWQKVLGRPRWKISLRTGNEAEATRKARALTAEHDAVLEMLEREGPAAYLRAELDKLEAEERAQVSRSVREILLIHKAPEKTDTVRKLVAEHFAPRRRELLDKLIAAATQHAGRLPVEARAVLLSEGGVAAALEKLDERQGAVNFYDFAMEHAPEEMKLDAPLPVGLTEAEQGEELRLRHAAAAGYREDLANLERLQGALVPTGAIRRPGKPSKTVQGDTISIIFEKWLASQGQREETARKWRIYKRRLVDVIGDKPVRDVTKADVRDYIETIAQLPNAATLPPSERAGSVQALLDWAESETDPKLVTAATVGKHLDFARAFFRWSARQDYCDASPAQDIQAPKDTRGEDDKVRPFTWSELQQLMDAARTAWGAQSARTLIVLAGAYTGARLEEICQLAPGNLELHGDVYAIQIDTLGGRQLKNAASRRVVPLPRALIDAGFVDFARARRGGTTIFGLHRIMGRYGRSFSPHFRRLRESVGLVGQRLRFHSLRHSYADLLRAKKVPDDASAQLMGHVGNRVRAGYGAGYGLDVLKGWVDLMEEL